MRVSYLRTGSVSSSSPSVAEYIMTLTTEKSLRTDHTVMMCHGGLITLPAIATAHVLPQLYDSLTQGGHKISVTPSVSQTVTPRRRTDNIVSIHTHHCPRTARHNAGTRRRKTMSECC